MSKYKQHLRPKSGFTLIECLVALLIISIVLASATRAMSLGIENVRDAYTREIASWLANNEYSNLYVLGTYPTVGNTQNKVTMAGITFIDTIAISTTPNPYFRKIDITIANATKPQYILFALSGFISQY